MSEFSFARYVYIAVLLLCLYPVGVWLKDKSKRHGPLPPGPKGKPLIGNLTDLPPPGKQQWAHWYELGKKYGWCNGRNKQKATMN